jgi:hypothetical protein
MRIEFILLTIIASGLLVLAVAWIRAIQRSRTMVSQYRRADVWERLRLARRMEHDSELEAYMRPLAPWEIAVAAIIVFGLLYAVAT